MSAPKMTDTEFWSLIDQARMGQPESADPDSLGEVLDRLDDDGVLDFGHMYSEKLCDLNQWRLWGAGYVIASGMSEDGFHYFRSWIVGKGKDAFEAAMKDPDELGPFVDDPEVENELLEYAAIEILERRGIEEDPRDRSERQADGEPSGEPFDEDAVSDSFPKLARLFGADLSAT